MDRAGNLYGTTMYGSGGTYGIVFKLDKTGKETILHRFTGGSDGSLPQASLTLDPKGDIYGTTSGGAFGPGTVFKITR